MYLLRGYEEFVWVVVVERWAYDVIEEEICDVKAICEYECVCGERYNLLCYDQECT